MADEEIKKGARNNKTDAQRLQQIHDYAVANGAQCATTAAKNWVTINGAHVLVGEGGGGGEGSRSSGFGSALDEFRFVNKRLAAGNLKRGERALLERRAEKLAKEYYSVDSAKGVMGEMDCIAMCQTCIKMCMDCISKMQACPNMDAAHETCIAECQKCIGVCQICISDLSGNTDMATCIQSCQKCAEVCMSCVETAEAVAASCDICKDMCQICSEACGKCAEMCQIQTGEISATETDTTEEMAAMSIDPNDMLINYGSAVKSLNGIDEKDFAVIYGGADLTKDFFEKSTEYGFAGAQTKRVPIMFNHAQPLETESGKRYVERKPIGEAELEIGDEGILIKEAILYNRKKYKDYLNELGWSTGAASHAVVAEPMPDGRSRIKQWLLSELSVTPMSAEPRLQNVVALKSLITTEAEVSDKGAQTNVETKTNKELDMEGKEEIKAMLDERDKTLIDTIKATAKAAVEETLDALPEVKAARGVQIEVTRDPADVPFKSLGEQLQAVAKATKDGNIAPRMRGLKAMETKAALGSNEAVPSQGEFLLEPTITQTLLQNVHDQGVFTQDVQKLPVGPNSNSGWIPGVDETSRATGSRWGGVHGYHSAEAATMTASQPKFRKINWELHKTYVLQYASDELLNDVGMLNAIIQKSSMEELDFMANYDVLLGVGGDRPAGVLNSGALISVSRAATGAVAHADIVAMWARMLPRNKARAKWYISSDVHAQLDQLTFTSGSTGILSPYVSYGPDGVMRIYGKPVVETEFNPALGTLGDILVADMSEYLYWEKNAVEAASSIHVQFLTDQTAFRFIYRNDGQTALASAITPANGSSNTQSPFVALLATT